MSTSVHSSILTALLALGCGCDQRQTVTGPSPDQAGLRGRVIDFRTEQGVSAVSVRFATFPAGGEAQTTTDGQGLFTMPIFGSGRYFIDVDGAPAGSTIVTGPQYRGDVFVSRGTTCISRYGTLVDASTLRPVSGATVSLGGGTVTTGPDGWYRIDLGCPERILPGGTTVILVTHPNYVQRQQVVGRGVQGVLRLDLDLERR